MTTTHQVIDPSTEEVLTELELAGLEETDAAIERAARPSRTGAGSPRPTAAGCCAASPTWSVRPTRSWPSSRCATPATPIANARWEAGNVRDVLGYYAAAPERLFGRQIPVAAAWT